MRIWNLGLLGYPLGHSLSPVLHHAALAAVGLKGTYRRFPIPPDRPTALAALLDDLRHGRLHGLNVTIPYKGRVLPYLDELTPTARAIGAVNTLYRWRGALWGENTDAPGFWADLQARLPQQAAQPGTALVLGAGGAARAVVFALLQHGWTVQVAARRPEQAATLCRDLAVHAAPGASCRPLPWDALSPSLPCDLLVNATPVGMAPHAEGCPWPEDHPLPPHAAVYDLVYNPRETQLLRRARHAGLPACDGLGMLIEQAALAFARWTGIEPPREALWAAVEGFFGPAPTSGPGHPP